MNFDKLTPEQHAAATRQIENAERALRELKALLNDPQKQAVEVTLHRAIKRVFGRIQSAGVRGGSLFSKYS
jgi:hypothetical protein